MQPLQHTEILGVRIHDVTIAEAVQVLERVIETRSSHHVVTVNPEFIMIARHHADFRTVLNTAELSVPDGIGVIVASRLKGRSIRARVPGIDLVRALARISAQRGFTIFMLGAASGVAEKAAVALQNEFHGLRIAGTFTGSPRQEDEDEIVLRVRSVRPDILLVAYGAPNQDLWIARNRKKLDVAVCIGVGGTFDFLAGVSVRAPHWIRKIGFEWLHRLYREPYRWRRMLRLPQFAVAAVFESFREKSTGTGRRTA